MNERLQPTLATKSCDFYTFLIFFCFIQRLQLQIKMENSHGNVNTITADIARENELNLKLGKELFILFDRFSTYVYFSLQIHR